MTHKNVFKIKVYLQLSKNVPYYLHRILSLALKKNDS